jgi:hypothetical protein
MKNGRKRLTILRVFKVIQFVFASFLNNVTLVWLGEHEWRIAYDFSTILSV